MNKEIKCFAIRREINDLLKQSKFTDGQTIYVLGSLLAEVLAGIKDREDAIEKVWLAIKETSKKMKKI